ncbi:hypothetical protein [Gilvimarinus sp. DA14]|uniref:hypothetical protein n=1 Tax=Gilvimarinus sp. DA14 TaxID=2956798 RepID=UPI0020B88ACB|nr:hypothetical protein [Gilvimarinus sp. DA14]UTF59356.1 hypothetical protein NHM04_12835 [Gilvimarinus sp. DA14]
MKAPQLQRKSYQIRIANSCLQPALAMIKTIEHLQVALAAQYRQDRPSVNSVLSQASDRCVINRLIGVL